LSRARKRSRNGGRGISDGNVSAGKAEDAAASDHGAEDNEYVAHPDFPKLPASVPLSFTLTMVACLSAKPEERPSFPQVISVLEDVEAEVARGYYMNSIGVTQVRWTPVDTCACALYCNSPSVLLRPSIYF
jgi:hypothetical protein